MKVSPLVCCATPGSMSGGTEPAETLLGGRVRMAGQEHGLKTTTDTVMLAAAVVVQEGARVLDAGCGAAGAMLCLAWRLPSTHITGLERDPVLAGLARRNIALNDAAARVTVHEGDIADARHPGERFDVVMTNPPHLDARRFQGTAGSAPRRCHGRDDAAGGLDRPLPETSRPQGVDRSRAPCGETRRHPRQPGTPDRRHRHYAAASPRRRVTGKAGSGEGPRRGLRDRSDSCLAWCCMAVTGATRPQAQRVLTQGAALEWC